MTRFLHILAIWVVALPAFAQFHARYTFSDFQLVPQATNRFHITPLWIYTISGTNFVTRDRQTYTNDSSGSLVVSNMVYGGYRVEFPGRWGVTTITNSFPTSIAEGDTVTAADPQYVVAVYTNLDLNLTAYSKAQSDARFLRRSNDLGTNLTFAGTTRITAGAAANAVLTATNANGAAEFRPATGATSGMGFTPLTNTSAAVTWALGYTPPTNTLAGILWSLGFTPPTNTFAGIAWALGYQPPTNTFTGITFGLGYIPATNEVSSYTSQGLVSTNDHGRIRTALIENQVWRKPPLFVDSWYNFGASWTEADIYAQVDTAFTNGLTDLVDIWYIVDDSWQGGITNGITWPSPSKFANITNFCAYLHNRNVKVILYTEPAPISSAGYPGNPSNWVQNAEAWVAWGIDGVKCDILAPSTDMGRKLDTLRRFAGDARQGAKFKSLAIFTGGWRDTFVQPGTSNYFAEEVFSIANAARPVTDFIGGTYEGLWTNYLDAYINTFERHRHLHRPSHWVQLDHQILNGNAAFDTNFTFGTWAMATVLNVPLSPPIIAGQDQPFRWQILTNRNIWRINQDVVFGPASRVSSNINGSVWVKHLADGARAVAFLNHQTNANFSTNVTASQMGWPTNQLFAAFPVLTNQATTVTSNTFTTYSVPVMCASLFIIYPTNALPVIDGTARYILTNLTLYSAQVQTEQVSFGGTVTPLFVDSTFDWQSANDAFSIGVPYWVTGAVVTVTWQYGGPGVLQMTNRTRDWYYSPAAVGRVQGAAGADQVDQLTNHLTRVDYNFVWAPTNAPKIARIALLTTLSNSASVYFIKADVQLKGLP